MPTSSENESLEVKVAVMRTQLHRIIADMESEKRTRMEANRTIQAHLERQDRLIYCGLGIVCALQFLVPVLAKVFLNQ